MGPEKPKMLRLSMVAAAVRVAIAHRRNEAARAKQ